MGLEIIVVFIVVLLLTYIAGIVTLILFEIVDYISEKEKERASRYKPYGDPL